MNGQLDNQPEAGQTRAGGAEAGRQGGGQCMGEVASAKVRGASQIHPSAESTSCSSATPRSDPAPVQPPKGLGRVESALSHRSHRDGTTQPTLPRLQRVGAPTPHPTLPLPQRNRGCLVGLYKIFFHLFLWVQESILPLY